MELQLKLCEKDPYPTCGCFIEGNDLTAWIAAIDRLGLSPTEIRLYGLPTQKANVVWGALVLTNRPLTPEQLGPLAAAHRAARGLVVPAKSQPKSSSSRSVGSPSFISLQYCVQFSS